MSNVDKVDLDRVEQLLNIEEQLRNQPLLKAIREVIMQELEDIAKEIEDGDKPKVVERPAKPIPLVPVTKAEDVEHTDLRRQ